jgi:hypothetical protein
MPDADRDPGSVVTARAYSGNKPRKFFTALAVRAVENGSKIGG